MNCKEQCFGCHGLYDVDDVIASSRRSSLDTPAQDPEVEKSDVPAIRAFYDLYKKSYDTHTLVLGLCYLSCSRVHGEVRLTIRGMNEFLYYYLWI